MSRGQDGAARNSALDAFIESPVTALASSAILAAAGHFQRGKLAGLIAYGFAALCLLYCTILIAREIARRRRWRQNIMHTAAYDSVDHEWQIRSDGSFHGRYGYTLTNRGRTNLECVPDDNVLWHKKPDEIKFKVRIHNMPGHASRTVSEYEHGTYDYILHFLDKSRAQRICWSHVLSPPLEPGGTVSYTVTIDTPRTEVAAFSEQGTYAGVPANIPTRAARLRFIAPEHFDFVILEAPIVVDSRGKRQPELEAGVNRPEISANQSMIEWNLKDLRTGMRYWFKYRLIPEPPT